MIRPRDYRSIVDTWIEEAEIEATLYTEPVYHDAGFDEIDEAEFDAMMDHIIE